MQTDKIKINMAQEISTEQTFHVIEIRKSIDYFLFKYFPEAYFVRQNPKKTIKNQS